MGGEMAPKKKPPAAEEQPTPMVPGGDTESWEASKGNHLAIANKCLADPIMLAMLSESLKAKVVAADYKWDKLPEEVVCSMDIYGIIGTYLGSHYVSTVGANKRKILGAKTALAVFGGIIQQSELKWSSRCSAEHKVCCPPAPTPAPRSVLALARSRHPAWPLSPHMLSTR